MSENGLLSLFQNKENVLENVLQKTPFGFSLINEDYVFEFANEAWLKIVQKGKRLMKFWGKEFFDIFPETETNLLSIFEIVKNTKVPFYAPEQNIKLERKGLLQDVFNFVYQPIYTESGEFQYFASVVIEVTD